MPVCRARLARARVSGQVVALDTSGGSRGRQLEGFQMVWRVRRGVGEKPASSVLRPMRAAHGTEHI